MPNTFITPTDVVMDASLFLSDELVVGNLVNRNTEARFANKVGDTVQVKVPPSLTASEFTSTTSAVNVQQVKVDVTLQKHFYVRVDLTSDELTLELDDFNTNVTMPAIRALTASIEDYFLSKIVGGFNRYLVGTAGNNPSTHAHILAGEQQIFENKGDVADLVGIITPTAHTSLAQLNIFTNADFGAERPDGLRSNSLGKLSNVSYFRSPYAGTLDRGDIAGTVLVSGSNVAGSSTLAMKAFTAATGTIKEGTRFTCAGTATVYTVTADTAIAANAATVPITPVLSATEDDDDAITFQSAPKECVIYNPRSVAGALVPGAIVGPNVAAMSMNGLGVRIISDVSVSTLAGTWVFDLYAGARVIKHEFGAVFQG